jgi:hypothetical protein
MAGETTRARQVLMTLLVSSTLMACTDIAALVRRHTYPPNFQYITQDQLHSTMWQLADSVRRLDAVMRQPGPIDAARRADIESQLRAMLDTTTALQSDGRPTNHPLLTAHLDRFRRDVTLALAGVEANPPSYYLVGSVSGACLTCHSAE